MTWKEIVKDSLYNLGGHALLQEIYTYIGDNYSEKASTKTWENSVRAALERSSSDSTQFDGKEDIFYAIDGLGNGKWGLRNFDPKDSEISLIEDDLSFSEGRKLLKEHISRERSTELVARAKRKYWDKYGCFKCEICGFDFEEVYGELGKGFIEAHHIKPVSQMKDGEKTKIEDIILICSNCHSMIHRKKPWLNKEELEKLLDNK